MTDELTPEQRAAELLALLGPVAEAKTQPPKPAFPADLVPEVDEGNFERSELDKAIDSLLDGISIDDAYRRWCGKMEPKIGNKRESVMISCPIPEHPDKNPSAWMNIDKGTWYCGGCQQGGDIYDLAAFKFGFPVPQYKSNGDFPLLRKSMAEDFGMTVIKGHDGTEYPVIPGQEPPAIPVEEPKPEPNLASVTHIPIAEDAPIEEDKVFEANIEAHKTALFIDWENIVPPGTFLWEWMQSCAIDDLPPEYYYWLGLQALGFIGRTDVLLADFRDVKPNLNICLYGPTGSGKSRSIDPYTRLLRDALPYDGDPYSDPTGVNILPVPGSSEALIDSLRHEILDPATNKPTGLGEVTGLLKFEEFASFIAKASRAGSSLKEIMIELYDVTNSNVTIHSRTSGLTVAKNPFVQVVTTTQPQAIHAFLRKTDAESGFLNRWVFATGIPRIAPIAYGGATIDIYPAAQLLKDCKRWAGDGKRMYLTGDALKAWEEFFYATIAPQKTGERQIDSILSRVELIIKKIIVLLSINEHEDHPTEQIVRTAAGLYDYLVATFSFVSGDIAHTDSTACQEALMTGIREYEAKYKKSPTRRDIVRIAGRRFDMDTIDRTLKTLISMEVILETKPPVGTRGRPAMRYTCGD